MIFCEQLQCVAGTLREELSAYGLLSTVQPLGSEPCQRHHMFTEKEHVREIFYPASVEHYNHLIFFYTHAKPPGLHV